MQTAVEKKDEFALGHIDGNRFKVPRSAMFTGVSSRQSKWLEHPYKEEPNSFDRPIAEFDLDLHLPDVSFGRYRNSAQDDIHRLIGTVSSVSYRENQHGVRDSFFRTLSGAAMDGPYIKRAERFGLEYWILQDTSKDDIFKNVLYSSDENVLILCSGPEITVVENGTGRCTQTFDLPELSVSIELGYDRKWLNDWKNIRRSVSKIVHSFVVA